jgi:heme exporter protein C
MPCESSAQAFLTTNHKGKKIVMFVEALCQLTAPAANTKIYIDFMDTAISPPVARPLRGISFLGIAAGALLLVSLYLVFFFAPRAQDASGGQAQRIFYFHVSSAWVGFLAWFVAAYAAVRYLRSRDPKWDRLGFASAEIGVMFMVMMLLSGMLWARPTWNAWWTWDYKLTLSLLQFLLFVAYLVLRSGIDHPEKRARFAAVYTVLGSITIPLNFVVSRVLENSVHPTVFGDSVNGRQQGDFGLANDMRIVFYISALALTLVYVYMLRRRTALQARLDTNAERRAALAID